MRRLKIVDHRRLDVELAIGEELDQHRLQQGLVGRLHLHDRQRPQARAQIGDAELLLARRRRAK